MPDIALKLEGIHKSFGGIHALKDVSFELSEGEVHALLGENGAGKSTLIKILTGVHKMDSGIIQVRGKTVTIEDPVDARHKGIGAIYQELSLVDSLTVAENIFLGHEPSTSFFGTVRKKELIRRAAEYLLSFGIKIDPNTLVGDLGLGQKRIVEIIKALSINANILLLDEPTTGMSRAEIDTLFEIMDDLKIKKVNMIYISHHLDEVFRVCDRATVLRDGQNAGTFEIDKVDLKTLVKSMLGRTLKEEFPVREGRSSEETLLGIKEFKTDKMLAPISFSLKKGEILGITGIIGSGKSELALGLFGADRALKGKISIGGREVRLNSPDDAKRHGISFIPEDRKEQGLFLRLNVEHNICVANIDLAIKNGIISSKKKSEIAKETSEKLKVRPLDIKMAVQNLSGGNQQKVVIGKWLCGEPDILILDEPTRGIDIGAKTEIYSLINYLADRGTGILIMSSEFREMSAICDRILVIRKGTIVAELEGKDSSTEQLLTLALGG
ncbi:MAG: sugar ABC transporter ATP-binding protein [Kosmotogaceae bacterium]|nr:sugar ABC transporter ATP-binding protein [Kosmotogaceae bacterium]